MRRPQGNFSLFSGFPLSKMNAAAGAGRRLNIPTPESAAPRGPDPATGFAETPRSGGRGAPLF